MLFKLKRQNRALWNAAWGARMINVANSAPAQVLSFVRQNRRDKVFAVFNLSERPQVFSFHENLHYGSYVNYFAGETIEFAAETKLKLERWEYRVFVR